MMRLEGAVGGLFWFGLEGCAQEMMQLGSLNDSTIRDIGILVSDVLRLIGGSARYCDLNGRLELICDRVQRDPLKQ